MDASFPWQRFDRIAKMLGDLGYVVAIFGPLLGIGMLVMGDWIMKVMGVAVLFGSFLVAAYHISFSLLMGAIRDLSQHVEEQEKARAQEHAEG